MRIIEEKEFQLEIECPKCHSRLGIESQDVSYGDFGVQYADDHEWHYYVQCLICEKHIKLKADQLTPKVIREAEKRGR